MKTSISSVFALSSALILTACGGGESHPPANQLADMTPPPAGATAEAVVIGTSGETIGAAIITDGPHGMILRVDVTGLAEGFHGIHLHQIGDCSDHDNGFRASGSHVNPAGNEHGLLNPNGFEAADLPNVYAHASGHARAELFVIGVSASDVLDADGFAVVVHQNQDDHLTQPIGGAGPRVGCAAFNG